MSPSLEIVGLRRYASSSRLVITSMPVPGSGTIARAWISEAVSAVSCTRIFVDEAVQLADAAECSKTP